MNVEAVIAGLDNEIIHLRSIFSTYKRLFRSDHETRVLLSDSDPAFFNDLYLVYLHYISVAVSRLLDPKKTRGKTNLTLFTLISILEADGHSEASSMKERLESIKVKAYNFTDPRNQLVSHLDYDANLTDTKRKAIPSFIVLEFEEFYVDVGLLMNGIRKVLKMEPMMYEWDMVGHGHGRKLICRLQTAYDHLYQKQRTKAG